MTEYMISRLGHQGDGVIETPEGPVFASFALPCEKITGDREDDRIANARILEPSPDRVKPVCSHFKTCGGCVVQNASEALQKEWRIAQIEAPLRQNGIEKSVDDLFVSPAGTRRRADFVGRRTKTGGVICFHRAGSHELIDLTDCKVQVPEIRDRFDLLRHVAGMAASRRTEVGIHVTATLDGLDIVVRDAKGLSPADTQNIGALDGIARLTWNDELVFQATVPKVDIAGIAVPIPAGAFLQATKSGADAMADFALRALDGAKFVADLFAGCGTLSLALARMAKVDAFESDASALDALSAGASMATGLRGIQTYARDLFRNPVLSDELKPYDAVVLDPPRAGAATQIAEIAKSNLGNLVYISCSPASFARDARVLIDAGFNLQRLEGIDQFRWSKHIELQAHFTR